MVSKISKLAIKTTFLHFRLDFLKNYDIMNRYL